MNTARDRFPIDLVDDHWVVREDVTHEGWDAVERIIPAGFETDLASVPWMLGWLFPRFNEARARAALPHDYFYRLQLPNVSRQAADRMFLRDLMIRNRLVHRAILMYYGLRMFGWVAWKKKKKQAAEMRARWNGGTA